MDSPPPNIERLLQERAIAGWNGGTYDPHWPALAQCLDHSLTQARRSLGCCVAQLPIARFRGATQREAPSTDLPTPSRSSGDIQPGLGLASAAKNAESAAPP